jgi:hypothetical protein
VTTYKAVCQAIGQGSPRSGVHGGLSATLFLSDSRLQWAMPFARTLSRPPSHVTVSSHPASSSAASLASGVLTAVRAPSASARWIYSHGKASNSPRLGFSSTQRMFYGRKRIAEWPVSCPCRPLSMSRYVSPYSPVQTRKPNCVRSPSLLPR